MASTGLDNPRKLRPISLRISVTDLCQYRCLYCTPPEGVQSFPHWRILRYEEMLTLVHVLKKHLGLAKVHLTGGEPLVRADVVDFVSMLAKDCTVNCVPAPSPVPSRPITSPYPNSGTSACPAKLAMSFKRTGSAVASAAIEQTARIATGRKTALTTLRHEVSEIIPVIFSIIESVADERSFPKTTSSTGA